MWRRPLGGCHLNRPIDRLMERAGLGLAELETGHVIRRPRFATFDYRGRARA
jgi:hypothetical protein